MANISDLQTPSQASVSRPVVQPQPLTNSQGLTAQQMGAVAGNHAGTSIDATNAVAVRTPGVVVPGAQTGYTNASSGIPSVPTQYQAYNQATPAPTIPPPQQQQQNAPQQQYYESTDAYGNKSYSLTPNQQQAPPQGNKQAPQQQQQQAPVSATQAMQGVTPPPQKAQTGVVNDTTRSAVDTSYSPSGVVTTDTRDSAAAALGTSIQNAKTSSLTNIPLTNDPIVDAIIANLSAQTQQIGAYIQNPNLDPKAQALDLQEKMIAGEKAAAEGNIQSKADQAYSDQIAANAEALGKMRVALATGGLAGSPLGLSILAGTYKGNARALQDIRTSENEAITQAEQAFAKDEFNVAIAKLDLVDQRRDQYNTLLDKQYSVVTQMKQQALQIEQFKLSAKSTEMQLQAQGKANAQDYLSTYAKQGLDPSVIPDTVWQAAVDQSGGAITTEMAKNMYVGSLKDERSSDAKAFNENTTAFYQTAAQIKDPNTTLYRPNPDGTFTAVKKSEIQSIPNYDTFQVTKNGKQYAVYVDKSDPTKRQEVELGTANKSITYKEDPFGNTNALIDNGDGTVSVNRVLDVAGNPVSQQALTNTTNYLTSNGTTYTQGNGGPAWTAEYPDGSVHTRGNAPAPECGQFVNDVLKTHFPDSIDGKIKQCDPTIGQPNNPVKMGDAIVTAEAAGTGHVAIINSIQTGPDGKTYYTLTESNYKKNKSGQGIVTNTRTLPADSPLIRGYARGQADPATQTQAGPELPSDNGASWKVTSAPDTIVGTHIKNGVVKSVEQSGTFKDGTPMYNATIKDDTTGTEMVYSGLKTSELRIGSSWDETSSPPPIGKTGSDSYVVSANNGNGAPLMPKGQAAIPLSQQIQSAQANGKSAWGQYDFIPTSSQAQTRYERIRNDLAKNGDLDGALQRMKSDPILSQVKPETYISDFQSTADTGDLAVKQKELALDRTNQMIRNSKMIEVNRALQAIPTYQFDKSKGVVAQAALAEITANRAQAAMSTGSDFELLDALTSFVNSGGKITEGQMSLLQANQTPFDKLEVFKDKASGEGRILSDKQRETLYKLVEDNVKLADASYQKRMAEYQTYLDANGIDFQLAKLSPIQFNAQTGLAQDESSQNGNASYYQSQLQPGETLMQDAQGSYVAVGPNDDTTGLILAQ